MLFDYINFRYFLVSLAVGLFFVYVMGPEQATIIVYPTSDNIKTKQYVDKADNCYTFTSTETDCPMFSEQMTIPVQK